MTDKVKPIRNRDAAIKSGQAYNLAIATAIADNKHHDNEYIVKQYLRHMQFITLLKKSDPQTLADAIKNPKILEFIKEFEIQLVLDASE